MEQHSTMQWKGSQPERFGGHRTHLRPEDSLAGGLKVVETPNYFNGIKCYQGQIVNEAPERKFLKTYEHTYKLCDKEIDPRGKKYIDFAPTTEPPRKEKLHISMGECNQEKVERGIKTFDEANGPSRHSYDVEEKLQRKARVLGLTDQRNGLGVTSLGDKSYKYPEYASNFYKEGGLIVGSSNAGRKKSSVKAASDFDTLKIVSLTKPNWNEKVKQD